MRSWNFRKEPKWEAYISYLLFVAGVVGIVIFLMGCVANSKPTYKLYEVCEKVGDNQYYMYDVIPKSLKRIKVDIDGNYKSCTKEGLIEVRNLEETK